MKKERMLVEGVEVEFNDLLEKAQKRLYMQDRGKFEKLAAKSQFAKVRRLVIEDEKASAANLEEIFKLELENNIENMQLLWNHPNFKRNDKKRRILSESKLEKMRKIPSEDKESHSALLNEILRREIQEEYGSFSVMDEVINNENFKMEEVTREKLAKSHHFYARIIAAQDRGTSSKFLNEMLRSALQNEELLSSNSYARDVIKAIMKNENFKMEEETQRMLAKSKISDYRIIAADKSTSSKMLNEMLRREIQENEIPFLKLMKMIILNKNFEIEDETLEMIYQKPVYTECKILLARDEKTSYEFLEKMYSKAKNEELANEKLLEAIEVNLMRKLVKKISTTQLNS